jgi:hypothetical protein
MATETFFRIPKESYNSLKKYKNFYGTGFAEDYRSASGD